MTTSTLTSEFVADTMGLVLHLERRRLGSAARSIFAAVESGEATVHIPGLVFAEILYLSERRRIGLSLDDLAHHLQQFPGYREAPLTLAIAQAAAQISDIPELHDRLIAGTARWLALQLITNDPTLQSSAFVKTIW